MFWGCGRTITPASRSWSSSIAERMRAEPLRHEVRLVPRDEVRRAHVEGKGRPASKPEPPRNSARLVVGSHSNQWSKVCAPVATSCVRGTPCKRTASSTCASFHTMVVVGTSFIRPCSSGCPSSPRRAPVECRALRRRAGGRPRRSQADEWRDEDDVRASSRRRCRAAAAAPVLPPRPRATDG